MSTCITLPRLIALERGNKFLDDAMLTIFRGSDSSSQDVLCVFKILEEFGKIIAEWDKNSKQPLDFLDSGVGIVIDRIMIGSIGGPQLKDFTVFGDAVNLAALIEYRARHGRQILVDHTTYQRARHLVAEVKLPEIVELRSLTSSMVNPQRSITFSLVK